MFPLHSLQQLLPLLNWTSSLKNYFCCIFLATLRIGYTSPNRHHVADALAVSDSGLRHRAVWKHDRSGTTIISCFGFEPQNELIMVSSFPILPIQMLPHQIHPQQRHPVERRRCRSIPHHGAAALELGPMLMPKLKLSSANSL